MADVTVDTQSFLNKSRRDKFLLVVTLPKAFLRTYTDLSVRELQISVYGTPVPSVEIPAIDVDFFGQQLKVTSQSRASYGPVNVNFTIDNEFKNYWILWKWLDLINDSRESGMADYFSKYSHVDSTDSLTRQVTDTVINKNLNQSVYFDYMTDMNIFGLDEYNNKRIKFTYKNAFITGLSEISYNYRDGAELESTATFAFSQLHSELVKECSNSYSSQ